MSHTGPICHHGQEKRTCYRCISTEKANAQEAVRIEGQDARIAELEAQVAEMGLERDRVRGLDSDSWCLDGCLNYAGCRIDLDRAEAEVAELKSRMATAAHTCETLADDGWVQVHLVLPSLAPT